MPFYKAFLTKFPTVQALAKASLGEVLLSWQGLGYNRRAKMLHEAAKRVVEEYKGKMPTNPEQLEALPGVGPYTARAVVAFATNQPVVFVETNLRTVVTHHFFPGEGRVSDVEVLSILEKVLPKATPERGSREWYAALMDYGSYLKRSGVRVNARASTYTKQKAFNGSARQARGAILKALSTGSKSSEQLANLLGPDRTEQMTLQLQALLKEGFIELTSKSRYQLPS
ncbi:MAG: A/G-specific adenine glycosylase [Parcubacteria group bacterium]|nr:A/G-specific adenine glycosylase [Parcubacteria group bacterium]